MIARNPDYKRAMLQYSNCVSHTICNKWNAENFGEIFVYGPVAQSRDQGPFKRTKVESTHNVSSTFAGFKAQSHFRRDIIFYFC